MPRTAPTAPPGAPSGLDVRAAAPLSTSPIRDLGALLSFRFARARRSRRLRIGLGTVAALTALLVLGPAYLDLSTSVPGLTAEGIRPQLLGVLPVFLAITLLSSAAAGGGREVLAKDQAAAFPVSPATDHLGALVMAPLNLAWIVQSWLLVALASFVGGAAGWAAGVALALGWMLAATAIAQALGWCVEWLRRGPHGRLVVTALGVAAVAVPGLLQATGRLADVAAALPTGGLAQAIWATRQHGFGAGWLGWMLGLLAVASVAVLAGIPPAAAVGRRPARDVERIDSRRHSARPDPGSDFRMLLRIDRASLLRSLPLRRGLIVTVLLPALGSIALRPDWPVVTMLAGLVASGATLLFGVNAWCLDGRGQLWRESLPVAPALVFDVRAWLLVETLLGSAAITVLAAAVRARTPTTGEVVAVLACVAVVTVQVTATSLHWSVRNPHQAELRSARATPAPPLVMVGYSARLALTTTLTGLLFSGFGSVGRPELVLALAVPMLLWSLHRWWRARRVWLDDQHRALVTVTVVG